MGRSEPRQVSTRDGVRLWVRAAEPGDAPATGRLESHMYETNPFKVSERGENERNGEEERGWIAEHLEEPGYLMLLAAESREPGGEVVGRLTFRNGNRRKLAHHGTFGISIHEAWRGRGVGTALIETLLDWGTAHPTLEKVGLGVFATNAGARRLYRRLGFVREGRSARHFRMADGRYVDDITMSILVKPVPEPGRLRVWSAGESR
jgi:RimJ/RimL family protein N-acetyltransferase